MEVEDDVDGMFFGPVEGAEDIGPCAGDVGGGVG